MADVVQIAVGVVDVGHVANHEGALELAVPPARRQRAARVRPAAGSVLARKAKGERKTLTKERVLCSACNVQHFLVCLYVSQAKAVAEVKVSTAKSVSRRTPPMNYPCLCLAVSVCPCLGLFLVVCLGSLSVSVGVCVPVFVSVAFPAKLCFFLWLSLQSCPSLPGCVPGFPVSVCLFLCVCAWACLCACVRVPVFVSKRFFVFGGLTALVLVTLGGGIRGPDPREPFARGTDPREPFARGTDPREPLARGTDLGELFARGTGRPQGAVRQGH